MGSEVLRSYSVHALNAAVTRLDGKNKQSTVIDRSEQFGSHGVATHRSIARDIIERKGRLSEHCSDDHLLSRIEVR
jgi:hypothetical protein